MRLWNDYVFQAMKFTKGTGTVFLKLEVSIFMARLFYKLIKINDYVKEYSS